MSAPRHSPIKDQSPDFSEHYRVTTIELDDSMSSLLQQIKTPDAKGTIQHKISKQTHAKLNFFRNEHELTIITIELPAPPAIKKTEESGNGIDSLNH